MRTPCQPGGAGKPLVSQDNLAAAANRGVAATGTIGRRRQILPVFTGH
jgi:hypothetical protein